MDYIETIEEVYFEEPIKVYVKINTNNEIIKIGSSMFINDLTDWIEIDEGFGDKYVHAQSQYFDKPLMNEDRSYNYAYSVEGGVAYERVL